MTRTGKISSLGEKMFTVVPIHQHEDMMDQCIKLINSEWPRSYSARMWSLKASKDTLPISLVLVDNDKTTKQDSRAEVLAHAKLSIIPSDAEAVFVESVVVDSRHRGQGLGRLLMSSVENHCFGTLHLKTVYLSTIDQQGFYSKLGYTFCSAVNIFGTRNAANNCTKKTWMKKTFSEWQQSNR